MMEMFSPWSKNTEEINPSLVSTFKRISEQGSHIGEFQLTNKLIKAIDKTSDLSIIEKYKFLLLIQSICVESQK